jgi:hypothetical protein
MTGAVASGFAFAMTIMDTAFETIYCIFSEEVYYFKLSLL